jgi:hypothetical protein
MAPGALALLVRGIVLASSPQASAADEPDDPERASKASCQGRFSKAGFLARVRLPQKQGLCQVVKEPDIETLSGF